MPQDIHFDESLLATLSEAVLTIARRAGDRILEVYAEDFDVDMKADDSPLTRADLAAHEEIIAGLETLEPSLPILSEESGDDALGARRAWSQYWLVDPLDGTKEFISRNGEFTVNIALIDNGEPRLGVVWVPVTGVGYWGMTGAAPAAWRIENDAAAPIRTRRLEERDGPVIMVGSRRHGSDAVEAMSRDIERELGAVDMRSMGSSLKFCLVASGEADFYPRLAPTSEWDTGAAQAVVEGAGGAVTGLDFKPLRYNERDGILNPHFYVFGDPGYGWRELLGGGDPA